MTFRCTRDCFIQVTDPRTKEVLVNQRCEMDKFYDHDTVDFTDYSRHFVKTDEPAPVVETHNELSGVIPQSDYAGMDRMLLIPLANERGIEGASKMNVATLVKRLTDLDANSDS